MKCPLCNIEARITKTTQHVNMEEQKLYRYMEFTCYNKKCKNYEKVIDEVREEVPDAIFD